MTQKNKEINSTKSEGWEKNNVWTYHQAPLPPLKKVKWSDPSSPLLCLYTAGP